MVPPEDGAGTAGDESKPQPEKPPPASPRNRRLRRVGLIAGITLAALVVVALIVVSQIEAIIQSTAESMGSSATGTDVTIGRVDVSLGGDGRFRDVEVANPKGYGGPPALSVREAGGSVAPLSLLSSEIKVREATIDGVRVRIVTDGPESNVLEIGRSALAFFDAPGNDAGRSLSLGPVSVTDCEAAILFKQAEFSFTSRFDTFRVSLETGKASIEAVRVTNPTSFSKGELLQIGSIEVDVDPSTITTEEPVIREVKLKDVSLLCETYHEESNIYAVLNEVEALLAANDLLGGSPSEGRDVPARIERLTIDGVRLHILNSGEFEDTFTVTVERIESEPSNGTAVLKNISVSNPQNFPEEPCVQLSEVHVRFTLPGLLARRKVIDEVVLAEGDVRLIPGAPSNLGRIRQMLTRLSPRPADGESGFLLKRFHLKKARAQAGPLKAELTDREVTDIRADSTPAIIVAVGTALAPRFGQVLGNVAGAVGEGAKTVGRGVGEGAKVVGKTVGEGAKKVGETVGEGVKGIFGRLLGGDRDDDTETEEGE
jgi:hypothetical protein